jgi:hypothetical protein
VHHEQEASGSVLSESGVPGQLELDLTEDALLYGISSSPTINELDGAPSARPRPAERAVEESR